MARRSSRETPDRERDPVLDRPAAATPARAYRLVVPHRHAGESFAAGAVLQLTEAQAAHIRAFAGADALVELRGE